MMQFRAIRNRLVAVAALAMVNGLADPAVIGIATSSGHFRVDNNKVLRNATLFEGTQVETDSGAGELRLAETSVALDANTKGTIFKTHLVLDQGKVQWTGGPAFRAEAGFVSVAGESRDSKAIVLRRGETVQVASLSGTVRVLNAEGALVSAVAAGTAMEFQDQSAGAEGAGTNQQQSPANRKARRARRGAGKLSGRAITGITLAATAAVVVPVAVVTNNDSKPVSR